MRTMYKTVIGKILPVSVLCFFCTTAAVAGDWHFSAEPLAGIRFGTVGEYVYAPDTSGTYQKLSELDWEIKPLWYFGGKISFGWKDITVSASASAAVPGRTGSMYDSDWQNSSINGDADTKTNYSVSENTLTTSYSLGTQLSYTFRPWTYVSLQPSAAVDYTYTAFEARNGYGWYADAGTLHTAVGYSYASDQAVYFATGQLLGIDYKREDVLTWLGITGIYTPVPRFTGTLSAYVSPYTYVQSLDRHYADVSGASHYYIDMIHGFFSVYKIETSGAYSFNKNLSLSLTVSWMFSTVMKGTDYYAVSSSGPWTEVSEVQSGASVSYGEARLAFRYALDF